MLILLIFSENLHYLHYVLCLLFLLNWFFGLTFKYTCLDSKNETKLNNLHLPVLPQHLLPILKLIYLILHYYESDLEPPACLASVLC